MAPPAANGRTPPISAFFKPKSSQGDASKVKTIDSADEAVTATTTRDVQVADPSASPYFASGKASRAAQPAAPRPDSDANVAKREHLTQWKFVPAQDEPESPSSSQDQRRTAPQQQRHEAFKALLLGPDDPLARKRYGATLPEEPEQPQGDVRSGAPASLSDGENGAEIAASDADGGDAHADEANTATPLLQKFAHAPPSARRAPAAPPPPTAGAKRKAAAVQVDEPKYTPLERQIVELKQRHPGVLLLIEVGYKFRFFGDDARVAARELHVACFPDRNFLTAMVPVHRLHVHVRKLVQAGYKVGVVRQTETRALKAAGSNASKPFERKLSALYTASTWIDDLDPVHGAGGATSGRDADDDAMAAGSRSLVCLVERLEGGSGADERVSVGMVAVQASTGSIVYDQFVDGHMRSELETRLGHLQPAELLLPQSLSLQTDKLLRYLAGTDAMSGVAGGGPGVGGERIRVERCGVPVPVGKALGEVQDMYRKMGLLDVGGAATAAEPRGRAGSGRDPEASRRLLAALHDLPQLCLQALSLCMAHLRSFGLESIFEAVENFSSFASRNEMLLQGTTLQNVEVFRNATDQREKGSLIWLLSAGCKTAMGKRLLRRWAGRPLTDVAQLEARLDAVQALVERGDSGVLGQLSGLLKVPDLERGLARLSYERATPTELATILLSLNTIVHAVEPVEDPSELGLGSSVLEEAVASLPRSRDVVRKSLAAISLKAAREDIVEELFVDPERYPAVTDAKDWIAVVDADLAEHLAQLRKQMKQPRLAWATVSGVEHLVEVRAADAKKVPSDWLRVSATQKFVRFHTPTVVALQKQRGQATETLASEARAAFRGFCRDVCREHYASLRATVAGVATLDALASLARVARLPGYARPGWAPGSDRIELRGFRHPMSEALGGAAGAGPEEYVPNDFALGGGGEGGEAERGVLLTGANMGGKSSTVRAIALNCIMAQLGSYVPCSGGCTLDVHDAILTRMGASDELAKRRSTFMVELGETSDILRAATGRSLVILDELGRGTSTNDGQAIAGAVLQHLLSRQPPTRRPKVLFVTHYFALGQLAGRKAGLGLRAMHMGYLERGRESGGAGRDEDARDPAPPGRAEVSRGDGDGDGEPEAGTEDEIPSLQEIVFLYKLRPGLAAKSFGIHCAALAGLPRDLLRVAAERSGQLQSRTREAQRRARRRRLARLAAAAFGGDGDGEGGAGARWEEEAVGRGAEDATAAAAAAPRRRLARAAKAAATLGWEAAVADEDEGGVEAERPG